MDSLKFVFKLTFRLFKKNKLYFGDNFRKSLIIDLWRNCLLHHTPQTNLLNQMYSFVRSIIQCQVVPLHPLTFNGSGSKPNEDPGLAMSSRLRMTRIFQVTRFKINSLFQARIEWVLTEILYGVAKGFLGIFRRVYSMKHH